MSTFADFPPAGLKPAPPSDGSKTGMTSGTSTAGRTSSFRMSPVSATPTTLWPGTPSPMAPLYAAGGLGFGVPSQAATQPVMLQSAAQQPVQQPAQVVYMQQSSPPPTTVVMRPQMPVMVQAPGPGMPVTTVMMAPPPVQTGSPGIGGNTGGQVMMGGVMPHMMAVGPSGLYSDPPNGSNVAQAPQLGTDLVAGQLGGLPSLGSAYHDGNGRCSPCAWVWKARGCQSGTSCGYCHLCPEGELKNRKKAKVAAIRMGAVESVTTAGGMVPPRAQLKLTTLL